jgi:hypothetical protein
MKKNQNKIIINEENNWENNEIMTNNNQNIINFDERNNALLLTDNFLYNTNDAAHQKEMGLKINIARKNLKENLKDFSAACEIEAGMMGRYERGTTEINESCILKISVNCLEKYNYYIDGDWIVNGNYLSPRFITKKNMKVKTVDQISQELKNMLESNSKTEVIEFTNHDTTSDFAGNCLFFTKAIDFNKQTDLLMVNYIDCYIEIENQQPQIALVSYDMESNCFIVNNGNNKPYKVLSKDLKKLNIIEGFYRKSN